MAEAGRAKGIHDATRVCRMRTVTTVIAKSVTTLGERPRTGKSWRTNGTERTVLPYPITDTVG